MHIEVETSSAPLHRSRESRPHLPPHRIFSLTDQTSTHSHLLGIIDALRAYSMLHIAAVADGALFAGGVGPSERGNMVGDDTPYTLARFDKCR